MFRRKKKKPSIKEGMDYPRHDCPQCHGTEFDHLAREIFKCSGCHLKVRMDGEAVISVI